MSYSAFARFYDQLTGNISYPQRAAYFDRLLRRHGVGEGAILLDLACGTGSLSLELAALGYDVIGVDGSPAMLSEAMEKRWEAGREDVLFLCQDMTELDLYGTIHAAVCALDSLNHITDPAALEEAIGRVSLFMEQGGVFAFDVNTPYKHETVLGNNTFVYDCDSVYCVWQNSYRPEDRTVEISLDFFEQEEDEDGCYRRSSESFCERAYPLEELQGMLERCGMALEACYHEDSFDPPRADTQRWVCVARKTSPTGKIR